MGYFLPDFAQGIDQIGPRGDLVLDAVDVDGDQRRFIVRDHGSERCPQVRFTPTCRKGKGAKFGLY
jgi:hypothetical protein